MAQQLIPSVPNYFEGIQPMDLLISYTLFMYGDLTSLDREKRIQIRFLFTQFGRKQITPEQFANIASSFGDRISKAAQKLITACISPWGLASATKTHCLTPEETMLAIAGVALGNSETISRIVMRSEDSWRRRITRVIQELRENKALDDEKKALVLEDTFSMAVPLQDNRTSCGKRLAQGLRLRALSKQPREIGLHRMHDSTRRPYH